MKKEVKENLDEHPGEKDRGVDEGENETSKETKRVIPVGSRPSPH